MMEETLVRGGREGLFEHANRARCRPAQVAKPLPLLAVLLASLPGSRGLGALPVPRDTTPSTTSGTPDGETLTYGIQ